MPLGGSRPRRYAEALLEVATEEGSVPAFRASLDRLATAFTPEIIRVLRDPRVPLAQRRAALDAGGKDEPKAVRATLEILLRRDRIALVPDIAREFGDLVDRREGIVKARITTSVELAATQRDDVVRRLEAASGKKVRATFAVDARLIAGAKVQVGDHLIDSSLRAQLDRMAEELAS